MGERPVLSGHLHPSEAGRYPTNHHRCLAGQSGSAHPSTCRPSPSPAGHQMVDWQQTLHIAPCIPGPLHRSDHAHRRITWAPHDLLEHPVALRDLGRGGKWQLETILLLPDRLLAVRRLVPAGKYRPADDRSGYCHDPTDHPAVIRLQSTPGCHVRTQSCDPPRPSSIPR